MRAIFILIITLCFSIAAYVVSDGLNHRIRTQTHTNRQWAIIQQDSVAKNNQLKFEQQKALAPVKIKIKTAFLYTGAGTFIAVIIVVTTAIVLNVYSIAVAYKNYQQTRLAIKSTLVYPNKQHQLPVIIRQTGEHILTVNLDTGHTEKIYLAMGSKPGYDKQIEATTAVKLHQIEAKSSRVTVTK